MKRGEPRKQVSGAGVGSVRGKSGERPLPSGAGGLCEQAHEQGATVGKSRKLAHVADALGESYGGGPASKQARKTLRRLKARVVVVEGDEDAGTAPQGRRDSLNVLGAQGGDGGNAPTSKRKPVEDALGHDQPRRCGAETTKSKHGLGAGGSLEPGC